MQRNDIENRLILAGVVGSTAYGLNRPDSDIDVKGICIATKEH
jgi:predicted nucleotidyltransferase